jgi:hypothetical protein
MTAKWPLPFVLVFGLTITRAADPTVTIDTASPLLSRRSAIVIAWVLIMGSPPLPDKIDLLVGLVGQGLAVGLGVWLLLRSHAGTDPAHRHPLAGTVH